MTTTPPPDKQPVGETPSARKIAEGIVNQIAVGAWQFCSPGWVINMIEEALRNRDERAAKIAEKHEGHGDWCGSAAGDCQSLTVKAIARAIREGK